MASEDKKGLYRMQGDIAKLRNLPTPAMVDDRYQDNTERFEILVALLSFLVNLQISEYFVSVLYIYPYTR